MIKDCGCADNCALQMWDVALGVVAVAVAVPATLTDGSAVTVVGDAYRWVSSDRVIGCGIGIGGEPLDFGGNVAIDG